MHRPALIAASTSRLALALGSAVLLATPGCNRIASYQSNQAVQSEAAPPDTAPPDRTPPDTELPDLPPTDQTVDGPPRDGTSDSTRDAARDAPPDQGPGDGPAPDQRVDLPTLEVGTDLITVSNGCNTLAVPTLDYGNNMVLCSGQGAQPQDQGRKFCDLSRGWDICTASQYRTRSAGKPTSATRAWIAGCLTVSNTNQQPPANSTCSTPTLQGPSLEVHWDCAGTDAVKSTAVTLGVTNHTQCRRIGVNSSNQAANWITRDAATGLSAALCCK